MTVGITLLILLGAIVVWVYTLPDPRREEKIKPKQVNTNIQRETFKASDYYLDTIKDKYEK